jgi:hypothetical protein
MFARGRLLALTAGLALVFTACGNDSTPPQDEGPPEGDEALSGNISSDRTLDASKIYVIQGIVSVEDGATLTIPAGTELRGSNSIVPSALLVRKGGRLVSNGTASEPVIFTSGKAVGSRARGDWGGVVLNGRSICSFLSLGADACVSEGASGEYGEDPPVLDDDSGVLTYTRIEYAGYEASFGNELNALTLNAVGSGTTIHHVQVHYGLDDGVELFGGSVDLKYILSTGNSDDSFDYSTGWAGNGQFWIAQQDPNDADTGFEVDGNEENYDATPYTDPQIYNVTLVGKGPSAGTAGESTTGMVLRRGTDGDIYNAIVMGFGTAGIDFDNAETIGRVSLQNTIFFENAVDVSADDDGIDDAAYLASFADNLLSTDPNLTDPYNRTSPDFRPTAGGNAMTATRATPPSNGFFTTPVDFIGGADPAEATPWYTMWTTTDQS